jgi:hypothetical protein
MAGKRNGSQTRRRRRWSAASSRLGSRSRQRAGRLGCRRAATGSARGGAISVGRREPEPAGEAGPALGRGPARAERGGRAVYRPNRGGDRRASEQMCVASDSPIRRAPAVPSPSVVRQMNPAGSMVWWSPRLAPSCCPSVARGMPATMIMPDNPRNCSLGGGTLGRNGRGSDVGRHAHQLAAGAAWSLLPAAPLRPSGSGLSNHQGRRWAAVAGGPPLRREKRRTAGRCPPELGTLVE